ncbi:MAG: type II secretion system F family protein [Pirellulales bacterium]|nr:type II secretion system F family protein [Pirellulales bacterium]
MNVSLLVMVLLASAAFATVTLSVALLVRDLRRGSDRIEQPLGPDLGWAPDAPAVVAARKSAGRIDWAFSALLQSAGCRLDEPTALALVAGAAVVGCAVPLVLLENLLAGAAGLLLGASLPLLWWGFQRAKRMHAMKKHLPETLELLADGVRAGQTLEQAAELVATGAPAPLSEEFGYCVSQLKLGHSPVAVLQRMARRIPLPEFKIFTTAVVVHRQTGGNLSLLAHRLATSARDRQEFHGHVHAVTAASRFSVVGLTLGTFAAVGMLAWLRPEYLETFLSHRLGPSLLATAAGLQILGIFWVWRTLRVQF